MIEDSSEAITAHFAGLRKRSGLTLSDLAIRLGYRGPSSLQRYENSKTYRGGYLQDDLIRKLENCLVGLGMPPIESADVIKLGGPLYERLRSEDRNHERTIGNILHVRLDPASNLVEAGYWMMPEHMSPLLSKILERRDWIVSLENPIGQEILFIDREFTSISNHGAYAVSDARHPGGVRVETTKSATTAPSSGQLLRTDVLGRIVARVSFE